MGKNEPIFHLNKALYLNQLNRYNEAINCFENVIKLDKNNSEAYYEIGNALYYLSRYFEAIENFNKAIELNSNDVDFHLNKGECLNALNKHAEALRCFDKAYTLDPDNLDVIDERNITFWNLFKNHA